MNRVFIIACIFFAFSCKTDPVAKPVPVIEINTPASNQNFVIGDTIHITGTVTHSMALKEVAVHMTDLSSNTEFFHNHFSAGNNTTFSFNSEYYKITSSSKSSFEVEVEADDNDGNTAKKEIDDND